MGVWGWPGAPRPSGVLGAVVFGGACLLLLAVARPTAGATPGLVAGYPFSETSGTSAADVSGNGFTATLRNGATWGPGRYGGAVQLDGADDFVDVGNPSALQVTGSLTLSAWIYATAVPFDDGAIISKRADGEVGYQLDTTKDRGPRTIGFKLTTSSGGQMWRYGSTTLQLNTWYHIAGVYDASARTLNVYLNGQLDNGFLDGTVAAAQQNSVEGVEIGRRPSVVTSLFPGRIDEPRIYGRALTQTEIQSDMNTPLAPPTGDTTPPTVAVTAPTAGATVNGIVNVVATAADNTAVAGVQFVVDGADLGAEDVAAPYGFAWDTRTYANGQHTVSARTRDTAGNTAVSGPVAVTVSNATFFQNEILITGLDLPTSIEFLPDGRMLVAELQGTIKILPPPYTAASPTPFLQIANIGSAPGYQQGIYDIALDPSFATNRYYYVFYTLGTPNRDRLARFTATADLTGTVPGSELVLYQDPLDAYAEHHGGAISFGNDGKLYFTTGEHFVAESSQLLTSPRGKIHRINKDGTVPADNPFVDGAGPNVDSIWARGLRNPFRAHHDPQTGRFFIADVGGNIHATAREELNVGVAGANYGWPNCEDGNCGNPAFTAPVYSYPHGGRDAAITGGFVYRGTQFPSSYQGNYFFADYTQNWIRRLTFDANGTVTGEFNFEPLDGSVDGPYGDIVYLTEGPDGALYYVDLGYSDIGGQFGVSKIRRIRYTGTNQAPTAVASASPASGPAPLTVSFSSAGSSDPEGQPITFSWTFGDSTTSTAADPTHVYAQPGAYTARVTVSDGVNSTTSTPVTITVGGSPTATITAPQDGLTFQAGDTIAFSGDGTDPEDGTLPASAFTWNIDFLHDSHVHPTSPIAGVKSGSYTVPTSGHDYSGNTRYRITLTVRDSNGLTASQVVTVYPQKVDLAFATAPPNLALELDGIPRTAPFVHDTLLGFNHVVNAPAQTVGGVSYFFGSWSDGGAQSHVVVAPPGGQSYTATFQEAADTTPPTAPASLSATAVGSGRIDLSWPASTDNVGVVRYRVERCQGVGCSTYSEVSQVTATTMSDSGLVPLTSYSYRVRAEDAAGNLSPHSSVATAQVLLSGLVAAYGFNAGSGSVLADASGLGNAGTILNATWNTLGRYGGALSFNGTNAHVTVPDRPSLDLTSAMTLEAWVRPSNVSAAWREVIHKSSSAYYLEATTNRVSPVPAGGGTIGGANVRALGVSVLPANTWTHLALTYNGSTIRLYVNGIQIRSLARTGSILTTSSALRIGSNGSGRYFQGLIDEVRIYNIALSASAIQADMILPIDPLALTTRWIADPFRIQAESAPARPRSG